VQPGRSPPQYPPRRNAQGPGQIAQFSR
jgi:hypothetical protein